MARRTRKKQTKQERISKLENEIEKLVGKPRVKRKKPRNTPDPLVAKKYSRQSPNHKSLNTFDGEAAKKPSVLDIDFSSATPAERYWHKQSVIKKSKIAPSYNKGGLQYEK